MKEYLEQLFEGKPLPAATAQAALARIAAGEANSAQISAFLACYRMRSPSTDEMRGFRRAMLDACIPVDLGGVDTIDVCGTGGDGKNTFNISTLTAFVVAGAGVKVAKHGNYSATSICGSSTLLERLGVKFTADPGALRKKLDHAGICFLHAPLFHPAMKHVAPTRRELGVRTFFNLLGPLLNPARPRRQLTGTDSLASAALLAGVLEAEGLHYAVVHSHDGYDEVSLTGPFTLLSRAGRTTREPQELGFSPLRHEELSAGPSVESAVRVCLDVLEGRGTPAQEAVVVANAGLALACARDGTSLEECLSSARESLKSKRALTALSRSTEQKA